MAALQNESYSCTMLVVRELFKSTNAILALSIRIPVNLYMQDFKSAFGKPFYLVVIFGRLSIWAYF